METFSKKAILETIEATKEYLVLLDSLLIAAAAAEGKVIESSANAVNVVESFFKKLTQNLIECLDTRKSNLIKMIKQYEDESLPPLQKSKIDILKRQNSSNVLLENARCVLDIGGFKSEEMYSDFIRKSLEIGSLPALPDMELIPDITFSANPSSIFQDISQTINNFGIISKIGPVQISLVTPYPGSLLVEWEEIDETHLDIQCYRLQMALYDAWSIGKNIENVFRDVYQGNETMFLVRDLRFEQKYCFRICCRISEDSPWSAWSCVKVASTQVPPYKWDKTNTNYLISDDDRLARVVNKESRSVLFSSGAHIANRNSVQFVVLNSDKSSIDDGVALIPKKSGVETCLKTIGSFFVSFQGYVFIDGQKKTICLPNTGKRDQLVFSCEIVKGKWRVTVERGAKAVTYDWNLGESQLYFATYLSQPEIQVLVE